jgi:ABC-type methionine transport system ATPase subunit
MRAKSFGDFHAVRDVSLDVAQGDIFGLIGKSGAGKSTLLRLINLLERPDAGAITVDGRELTSLSKRDLRDARANIGMIFQQFNLLQNASVFENVAFPLRIHGGRAAADRCARGGLPGTGGPERQERQLSGAAVGRAETARRHRARAGQRAGGAAVRRADIRAGCRNHARCWRR